MNLMKQLQSFRITNAAIPHPRSRNIPLLPHAACWFGCCSGAHDAHNVVRREAAKPLHLQWLRWWRIPYLGFSPSSSSVLPRSSSSGQDRSLEAWEVILSVYFCQMGVHFILFYSCTSFPCGLPGVSDCRSSCSIQFPPSPVMTMLPAKRREGGKREQQKEGGGRWAPPALSSPLSHQGGKEPGLPFSPTPSNSIPEQQRSRPGTRDSVGKEEEGSWAEDDNSVLYSRPLHIHYSFGRVERLTLLFFCV